MTTLLALEMPNEQIIDSIQYLKKVEGRMELLNHPYPFHIIVDYCQHAKSFEKVFEFANSVKKDVKILKFI